MLFGVLLTNSSRRLPLVTLTIVVSIGNSAAMVLMGKGWTITLGMVAVIVGTTVLVTHRWQCGEMERDA
uniref:Uncharacterized protein n=1 Tax=Romanomermis culicivorax TaxID=13658 RepID=A0A915I546_ROMCU